MITSVPQTMAIANCAWRLRDKKLLEQECGKGTQAHNAVNMKHNAYA